MPIAPLLLHLVLVATAGFSHYPRAASALWRLPDKAPHGPALNRRRCCTTPTQHILAPQSCRGLGLAGAARLGRQGRQKGGGGACGGEEAGGGRVWLKIGQRTSAPPTDSAWCQKVDLPDFGPAADRPGAMAPEEPIKSDQRTWRRAGPFAAHCLTSGYLASFLPLRYLLALNFWLLNAK
jgi:hypothetical protein